MKIYMRRAGSDHVEQIPAEQRQVYQSLGWLYEGEVKEIIRPQLAKLPLKKK